MGTGMNSECFVCQLKRYTGIARELGSDAAATDFAKDMMRVYLSAPEGVDSPWYGPHFAALLEKHFGLPQDSFRAEMEEANAFVRPRLDEIRQRIRAAEDPLLRAIQFSILGNYLDYNSLRGEVSLEKLEQMLLEAEKMELDGKVLAQLRGDLEKGGKLLLITDNAGEIGFDLCLAETVAAQYPGINITFLVRGGPAANDACRADAEYMGVPFPVLDTGSKIAGAHLGYMAEDAQRAVDEADIILSKGQANVECLWGCGKNIYYALLIKCVRFIALFDKPKLTPMLLAEQNRATPLF